MASRPCNPNADLKRLWQMVLRGTPFPACGVPGNSDAAAGTSVEPAKRPDDAEQSADRRAREG
jgi:hypothetical protein